MHPFHGGLYYGAARSNGFGYWTGLAFALAGSFQWECCAESHYMSTATVTLTGMVCGMSVDHTASTGG